MSDIDDGEDLEFLRAFEDELYNDTLSDASDDSLDSELEAELYQSVHFASSLVETPKNNSKEETQTDDSTSSTSLDSETNRSHDSENSEKKSPIDHVDAKPLSIDEKENSDDEDALKENSTNFYPEVELVFSKHEQKNKLIHSVKKDSAAKLFEAKKESDILDSSLSDSDQWGVIAADLIPNVKRKKRSGRCFNCNEIGHRTLECTQPKKEKICWLCGEVGHLKKRCRNELCFNCSEPGHQMKNCRKPRCRSDDTCNRCHAYGHFESFCPDRWRQYHHTIEEGEIIRGFRNDLNRRKIYCYNCGNKGHHGHECLEETDGHFDGSFPFVVKYDKYTSGYFTRNNKNIQSDDNMNVPRNSPRKNDRKSDFNDSIRKPSSSELNANRMNENADMGNKNKKKSKRSRKRKKRSGEEMLEEEEKAIKRRKVEGDKVVSKDHEGDQGQLRDQKLLYAEDNFDQMETFTNFNHTTPNLPLQSLMSLDVTFTAPRGRKRKRKNSQEQSKLQGEGTETIVKKKKNRLNQKRRKKMKLLRMSDNNTPSPAENGGVKKTKQKRKKKKDNINLEALSSPVNLNPFSNSTIGSTKRNVELRENYRNHFKDERLVVIKEPPKKPWKMKPKNGGEERKVYFNYTGFL